MQPPLLGLGTVHGRRPLVSPRVDEVVLLAQLVRLPRTPGPVLVLQAKRFNVEIAKSR